MTTPTGYAPLPKRDAYGNMYRINDSTPVKQGVQLRFAPGERRTVEEQGKVGIQPFKDAPVFKDLPIRWGLNNVLGK